MKLNKILKNMKNILNKQKKPPKHGNKTRNKKQQQQGNVV